MSPKKAQKKDAVKTSKCNFNNRGYCRLKDECENKHTNKVCNDLDCDEDECDMRHPNPCKFGPRCKFNKKQECMYLHVTSASNEHVVEKFDKMEKKIKEIETKSIVAVDSVVAKQIEDKFTYFESQISNLKKDLEIKNTQINSLDLRLCELEKEHQSHKKQQEKEIKDLENLCRQKSK